MAHSDRDACTLNVSSLTRNVQAAHLQEIFGQFGQVTSVNLAVDQTVGLPKGYAYVQFATESDANFACQHMNGGQVDGRSIKVESLQSIQSKKNEEKRILQIQHSEALAVKKNTYSPKEADTKWTSSRYKTTKRRRSIGRNRENTPPSRWSRDKKSVESVNRYRRDSRRYRAPSRSRSPVSRRHKSPIRNRRRPSRSPSSSSGDRSSYSSRSSSSNYSRGGSSFRSSRSSH